MTSFVPNDGADYMLGVLFGQTEAPLSTYWLGLVSEMPDEGDTGETIVEPTADPAYARIAVPNTAEVWELTGYGEVENLVDFVFPPVSAGFDWGVLVAAVLLDVPDLGAGRLLMCGSLTPPALGSEDIAIRLAASGLSLSLASIAPTYEPT